MIYDVEYTDTFGGEANYSWVTRKSFEASDSVSDRTLMRLAKHELGLSGVRGKSESLGETLSFKPYGSCTVMFVSPRY